ncbi:MAG: class I SAM-dependent methyltransferase [Acidobacteria bacterium]|nr:class I SAM-dependent methyltransferase [Acidobacteriota bacterium]
MSRASWLDHPAVARHYRERGLIDGLPWEAWVAARRGGSLDRTLELACGEGLRSSFLFEQRFAARVDGVDSDAETIRRAEANRLRSGAAGLFDTANLNALRLPRRAYDLVLVCHQLHQIVALEALLDQVYAALAPGGVFVIEGYTGPSRFQWTDTQMSLVRAILTRVPERLRRFPWGATKFSEARPDPAAVTAQSLSAAIRSGEIVRLFDQRFASVARRPLGGTLQHLLYNGIMHNFVDDDREADQVIDLVALAEDALIDAELIASDFLLMIGERR